MQSHNKIPASFTLMFFLHNLHGQTINQTQTHSFNPVRPNFGIYRTQEKIKLNEH